MAACRPRQLERCPDKIRGAFAVHSFGSATLVIKDNTMANAITSALCESREAVPRSQPAPQTDFHTSSTQRPLEIPRKTLLMEKAVVSEIRMTFSVKGDGHGVGLKTSESLHMIGLK